MSSATALGFLRLPLVHALALVFLSLTAYARTLNGWFLSDDVMITIVVPDGEHVDWDHVLRVFWMDWGSAAARTCSPPRGRWRASGSTSSPADPRALAGRSSS